MLNRDVFSYKIIPSIFYSKEKKKTTKRETVIVKNITSKDWLGVQNIYKINSDE